MSKIFDLDIDFPQEEADFFWENAKTENFRKDEYFHEAGHVCKKIGIVKSGLLKSFVIDEKGNERIVEFYSENSFVSAYTSFITQEITDWNIQAIEDSEILTISKDFLEYLYKRDDSWIRFGLKIFEKQTLKKCNREKSFLINNASERYLIFKKQYRSIENRLSLNQIALYLGIHPESFSRIRKDMTD
ncbi:Crp/Fnr family transcriptional regulator [Anaerophaga thermohalophila]|uniref:Crp/Fnr family transcriptional regulator n=1 Tax=Anaerophaga thermohalophila TaxID=177400 RepID=UPI0002EEF274|nr:Crp/Fnr family transcriptional regulator [Anaerophaga thermohalophila]